MVRTWQGSTARALSMNSEYSSGIVAYSGVPGECASCSEDVLYATIWSL